jgi:hypothetical protein
MTTNPDFLVNREAMIKAWGEPSMEKNGKLRWIGADQYAWRSYDDRQRLWYDAASKRGGNTLLDLARFEQGKPPLQEGEKLRGAEFIAAWQYAYDQEWIGKPPPPPKANGKGDPLPIRATYSYRNEQDELLFEVVRFDTANPDERFRQRRPDGKGGWVWKVKGTRIVLYRLPELIAAVKAGQRVLVCEGEKDANTAARLGYAATTGPGGVNKWRNEFDEFFRGADIVVVSDNDSQLKDKTTGGLMFHPGGRPMLPGQDHAAAITRRLRKVAAHVRTIIFPQHKDLTEWVEGGGTREQLDALIAQAPEETKQPDEPEKKQRPGATDDDAEQVLAELNRDNCIVLDGGRTLVLRFERAEHDAGGESYIYQVPTFLKFYDMRNLYLNRRILIGGDRTVDIGKWWLGHRERRQYRGVTFKPAGKPIIDGRLNLWSGWGVDPKRGEWGRLREHMYEVLAARDDDVDAYILNWLAWAVQHPDQQAEVALVFIGERGTGKGTLGKALCKIFGQHSLHLSSPEHLTGRFNSHLRQCSFLFGDECYGPKDKSAEGTLKRIITEDTLTIEAKGRDAIEEPNRLHVMLASNNEWVIPAGVHERRFMVQRVADTHRQDAAWFAPIYQQMRSGGYQAMLFDLLERDLRDWHPRRIVHTAALAEQQDESLSPLDAWWLELLQSAVLAGSNSSAPDRAISNKYEDEVRDSDRYGGGHTRTVKRDGLYDQARAVSPKLKGYTDAALGRYLRQQGCRNAWVQRHRGWEFPPLTECRTRWLERFPMTVWHDSEITEWTTGGED